MFNMEGGCYFKTIDLDADREPQIYNAIKFGAMLENIGFQQDGVTPDYFDASVTQNTRVSYPLLTSPGHPQTGPAPTPRTSSLYLRRVRCVASHQPVGRGTSHVHFLSGYTAKVAGTEVGVTELQATFSAVSARRLCRTSH